MAVLGGLDIQRLGRTGLHGIVPLLVSVGVFSKLKEAVLVEIDVLDINDGLWDQRSRDSILGREAVEP